MAQVNLTIYDEFTAVLCERAQRAALPTSDLATDSVPQEYLTTLHNLTDGELLQIYRGIRTSILLRAKEAAQSTVTWLFNSLSKCTYGDSKSCSAVSAQLPDQESLEHESATLSDTNAPMCPEAALLLLGADCLRQVFGDRSPSQIRSELGSLAVPSGTSTALVCRLQPAVPREVRQAAVTCLSQLCRIHSGGESAGTVIDSVISMTEPSTLHKKDKLQRPAALVLRATGQFPISFDTKEGTVVALKLLSHLNAVAQVASRGVLRFAVAEGARGAVQSALKDITELPFEASQQSQFWEAFDGLINQLQKWASNPKHAQFCFETVFTLAQLGAFDFSKTQADSQLIQQLLQRAVSFKAETLQRGEQPRARIVEVIAAYVTTAIQAAAAQSQLGTDKITTLVNSTLQKLFFSDPVVPWENDECVVLSRIVGALLQLLPDVWHQCIDFIRDSVTVVGSQTKETTASRPTVTVACVQPLVIILMGMAVALDDPQKQLAELMRDDSHHAAVLEVLSPLLYLSPSGDASGGRKSQSRASLEPLIVATLRCVPFFRAASDSEHYHLIHAISLHSFAGSFPVANAAANSLLAYLGSNPGFNFIPVLSTFVRLLTSQHYTDGFVVEKTFSNIVVVLDQFVDHVRRVTAVRGLEAYRAERIGLVDPDYIVVPAAHFRALRMRLEGTCLAWLISSPDAPRRFQALRVLRQFQTAELRAIECGPGILGISAQSAQMVCGCQGVVPRLSSGESVDVQEPDYAQLESVPAELYGEKVKMNECFLAEYNAQATFLAVRADCEVLADVLPAIGSEELQLLTDMDLSRIEQLANASGRRQEQLRLRHRIISIPVESWCCVTQSPEIASAGVRFVGSTGLTQEESALLSIPLILSPHALAVMSVLRLRGSRAYSHFGPAITACWEQLAAAAVPSIIDGPLKIWHDFVDGDFHKRFGRQTVSVPQSCAELYQSFVRAWSATNRHFFQSETALDFFMTQFFGLVLCSITPAEEKGLWGGEVDHRVPTYCELHCDQTVEQVREAMTHGMLPALLDAEFAYRSLNERPELVESALSSMFATPRSLETPRDVGEVPAPELSGPESAPAPSLSASQLGAPVTEAPEQAPCEYDNPALSAEYDARIRDLTQSCMTDRLFSPWESTSGSMAFLTLPRTALDAIDLQLVADLYIRLLFVPESGLQHFLVHDLAYALAPQSHGLFIEVWSRFLLQRYSSQEQTPQQRHAAVRASHYDQLIIQLLNSLIGAAPSLCDLAEEGQNPDDFPTSVAQLLLSGYTLVRLPSHALTAWAQDFVGEWVSAFCPLVPASTQIAALSPEDTELYQTLVGSPALCLCHELHYGQGLVDLAAKALPAYWPSVALDYVSLGVLADMAGIIRCTLFGLVTTLQRQHRGRSALSLCAVARGNTFGEALRRSDYAVGAYASSCQRPLAGSGYSRGCPRADPDRQNEEIPANTYLSPDVAAHDLSWEMAVLEDEWSATPVPLPAPLPHERVAVTTPSGDPVYAPEFFSRAALTVLALDSAPSAGTSAPRSAYCRSLPAQFATFEQLYAPNDLMSSEMSAATSELLASYPAPAFPSDHAAVEIAVLEALEPAVLLARPGLISDSFLETLVCRFLRRGNHVVKPLARVVAAVLMAQHVAVPMPGQPWIPSQFLAVDGFERRQVMVDYLLRSIAAAPFVAHRPITTQVIQTYVSRQLQGPVLNALSTLRPPPDEREGALQEWLRDPAPRNLSELEEHARLAAADMSLKALEIVLNEYPTTLILGASARTCDFSDFYQASCPAEPLYVTEGVEYEVPETTEPTTAALYLASLVSVPELYTIAHKHSIQASQQLPLPAPKSLIEVAPLLGGAVASSVGLATGSIALVDGALEYPKQENLQMLASIVACALIGLMSLSFSQQTAALKLLAGFVTAARTLSHLPPSAPLEECRDSTTLLLAELATDLPPLPSVEPQLMRPYLEHFLTRLSSELPHLVPSLVTALGDQAVVVGQPTMKRALLRLLSGLLLAPRCLVTRVSVLAPPAGLRFEPPEATSEPVELHHGVTFVPDEAQTLRYYRSLLYFLTCCADIVVPAPLQTQPVPCNYSDAMHCEVSAFLRRVLTVDERVDRAALLAVLSLIQRRLAFYLRSLDALTATQNRPVGDTAEYVGVTTLVQIATELAEVAAAEPQALHLLLAWVLVQVPLPTGAAHFDVSRLLDAETAALLHFVPDTEQQPDPMLQRAALLLSLVLIELPQYASVWSTVVPYLAIQCLCIVRFTGAAHILRTLQMGLSMGSLEATPDYVNGDLPLQLRTVIRALDTTDMDAGDVMSAFLSPVHATSQLARFSSDPEIQRAGIPVGGDAQQTSGLGSTALWVASERTAQDVGSDICLPALLRAYEMPRVERTELGSFIPSDFLSQSGLGAAHLIADYLATVLACCGHLASELRTLCELWLSEALHSDDEPCILHALTVLMAVLHLQEGHVRQFAQLTDGEADLLSARLVSIPSPTQSRALLVVLHAAILSGAMSPHALEVVAARVAPLLVGETELEIAMGVALLHAVFARSDSVTGYITGAGARPEARAAWRAFQQATQGRGKWCLLRALLLPPLAQQAIEIYLVLGAAAFADARFEATHFISSVLFILVLYTAQALSMGEQNQSMQNADWVRMAELGMAFVTEVDGLGASLWAVNMHGIFRRVSLIAPEQTENITLVFMEDGIMQIVSWEAADKESLSRQRALTAPDGSAVPVPESVLAEARQTDGGDSFDGDDFPSDGELPVQAQSQLSMTVITAMLDLCYHLLALPAHYAWDPLEQPPQLTHGTVCRAAQLLLRGAAKPSLIPEELLRGLRSIANDRAFVIGQRQLQQEAVSVLSLYLFVAQFLPDADNLPLPQPPAQPLRYATSQWFNATAIAPRQDVHIISALPAIGLAIALLYTPRCVLDVGSCSDVL